ncbi:MAG: metalloregulator ArsR/SmtB family transcription factor [bacterium]|uniref:Regulatory protein, ArsR n=2 Tax=Bacteria candidate phyla TaxID=1783234 RepID=A0A101I295_UNCT6|nr:MAG: Regulatory protein, ArsR [candidate division TA06 bacterium 32_111]KUK86908.1 MAG: Regulatory protein, ArsR [candidate division TA06 bacterium 34_109]MDI6700133.1 metalloregulator ArsR/SmtB family transcription factor [bacterium]HAF07231.1 transcriptional regulator [candidate division WOR-3 bacterium]HCP16655.1 transcriptional regulator [candidate division WOR-3 bacterium]
MKKDYELLNKLKALSDGTRLEIVALLIEKKMCVCELSKILNMSQPRVSRHLKILTDSGILDYEKTAQKVFYSVKRKDPLNEKFFKIIKGERREKRKNKNSICLC